jgi:L-ascorbate metabolism protein UlaG (beta-lactamase superfamily)
MVGIIEKSKTFLYLALLAVFLSGSIHGIHSSAKDGGCKDQILESDLENGEAFIWYLGHAGWAVKTRNHLLIFDYVELSRTGEKPENPSLAEGSIDPSEIKDCRVFVFVSHGHGDHFDPAIFKWENSIENITYIFGWQADKNPKYVYLKDPRVKKTFDDLEVYTVNHDFDGIPEVAYLLKVDDLVIYFSGDHGSTGEEINPVFKDNIDYLSQQATNIDMAFISQFGSRSGGEVNKGDLYTISKLGPKVTLPMHQGGGERFYKKFAQEAKQKGAQTEFFCAENRGDRFHYQKDRKNRN